MYLDYTDEEKALQRELRRYLREIMTPDLEDEIAQGEGGGPRYRAALQKMGRDGWLGIGWPREYGGQGRAPLQQFLFFDEVQRAGFPLPLLTLNAVGPTIMRHGTDAQRARFLPAILRGEVHFAIGYTEPEAGTDLASLRTRAERQGDVYVVNGQKVFTSLATYADYIWLAVRTDPQAQKHKGISLLIVDARLPGVTITPMEGLGDNEICATFYDDVRVPADCLVGGENQGWRIITTQLNHERVALMAPGLMGRLLEEVRTFAQAQRLVDREAPQAPRWVDREAPQAPRLHSREAPQGPRLVDREAPQGPRLVDCEAPQAPRWVDREAPQAPRLIDVPWVQTHLARVYAGLEVLKLLNWRQACNLAQAQPPPQEASVVKVFGSELYVEGARLLMEVLGAAGALRRGSPGALLQGRLERYYRGILVLTFGGGTNEVQRDIIATVGLGMPRSR